MSHPPKRTKENLFWDVTSESCRMSGMKQYIDMSYHQMYAKYYSNVDEQNR